MPKTRSLVLVVTLFLSIFYSQSQELPVEEQNQLAQELLRKAKTTYYQHQYQQTLRLIEEIRQKYPKFFGEEAELLKAKCYSSQKNYWQVINILENRVDSFKNQKNKLEGHLLLGDSYSEYGSSLSERLLRHFEIPFQHYNQQLKKEGSQKKELLTLLFKAQKALCCSYWDYNPNYQQWQKDFQSLKNPKKNWSRYITQQKMKMDELRIQKIIDILDYIQIVGGKKSHEAARAQYLKGCFWVNQVPDRYRSAQYYTPSALSAQLRLAFDKGIETFYQIELSDNLADDAHFLAAYTIHQKKNDLVSAVIAYQKFIRQFPQSQWAQDARYYLHQIEEENIRLNVPRIFLANETPKVSLQVRNTERLLLELRTVNLLKNTRYGYNYDYIAKKEIEHQRKRGIPPIKEWFLDTEIKPDHLGVSKEIELSNLSPGAYLLQARGNTKQAQIVLIVSDIVLVTRQANNRILSYVTNAITGKPVSKAEIAINTNFHYPKSNSKKDQIKGETNDEGLFVADLNRYGNFNSYSAEAIAGKENHYALVSDHFYQQNPQDQIQVLGYTNQPVYRPGQKVEFKLLFRTRKKGQLENLKKKLVVLYIQDPMGNKVYDKTLYTNEYGSIADTFQIKEKKEKPALGLYQFVAQIDGKSAYQENYQFPRFRIEEYKKPEFKVSVSAISEQLSFDEEIKAKISAEYYFGGPVVGGTVQYTIYTQPHYNRYSPRQKYDWYNKEENKNSYSHNRHYVTQQSNLSLDENGDFEIKFTPKAIFGATVDQRYFIEAQVIDKSRRMIKGQGTIYVSHKGFSTFLNPKKQIYLKGETVQVEVFAKTANGTPVSCEGELLVEVQQNIQGETSFKEVMKETLKTNNTGKHQASFIVDEEGYFRLTFKSRDKKSREILSQCALWVVSKEFRGNQSRFSDLNLIADKSSYQIGEKANILVNCHLPNSYALISVIGNQTLIQQKVLHIKGKSSLFSLELNEAYTPNVFVHCLVIKGNRIYQNELSLVIPPLQCFSSLEIKSDKETYLPGQKAKIEITTKDYLGKPFPMEVSLGATDASLYYIYPDPTPDIRKFFYGQARHNQLGFHSSLEFRSAAQGVYLPRMAPRRSFQTHSIPAAYQSWQYRFDGIREGESYGLNQFADAAKPGVPSTQDEESEEEDFSEAKKEMEPADDRENIKVSKQQAAKEGQSHARKKKPASGRWGKKDGKNKAQLGQLAGAGDKGGKGKEFKEAKVRTNFKDSCFWIAQTETNQAGKATIEITLPDNLTTWTLTSRGIDLKNRVGVVQKNMVTQKEIIIRPQQPRFFRERDLVTVSAIVQNNLNETLSAKVVLDIDEKLLSLVGMPENEKERTIRIRGKKDYRVDWVVSVRGEGETKIKMSALTTEDSDAVEQSFPVYLHGIEKYIAQNGVMTGEKNQLAGDDSHTFLVDVPKERIPESTRLTLTFSPTTASVILEALPYLARYPYGCVEQTMSRFLPSVLTAKTLQNLGLSINELMTQHQQKLARGDYKENVLAPLACLNDELLADMIEKGKKRLFDFQHSDGGWGWWKKDRSSTYMTSYVLFGLQQARLAGTPIDSQRIQRGLQFLLNHLNATNLKEEKELGNGNQIQGNQFAYILFSLSTLPELKSMARNKAQIKGYEEIAQILYQQRDSLNDYGRSLLALAFYHQGKQKEARDLIHQLLDNATIDKENDTVFFGNASGSYYWHQDGIETTAYALKAIVAIEPSHSYLPKMAKWLVLKRQGIRWKSTKDTAKAIYGLLDYLKLTGEMNPDYTLSIKLGTKKIHSIKVTKANLFSLKNQITFEGNEIKDGSHSFTIEKEGLGNLYYSLSLSYFTLEEDITAVKTEIGITRNYYKVEINEGKETRIPIAAGVTLKSGDLIDVELIVKNIQDCEYLIIEDFKPAGCEPLELTSGSGGGAYLSHREMRDELVAFFISFLPKGTHTYNYRIRAEIPGSFHTMPAMVQAMYAPHLRANSQEWRVKIEDE